MAVQIPHVMAVSPRSRHASPSGAVPCRTAEDCLAGARGLILGLPASLALWTGIIALLRTGL